MSRNSRDQHQPPPVVGPVHAWRWDWCGLAVRLGPLGDGAGVLGVGCYWLEVISLPPLQDPSAAA